MDCTDNSTSMMSVRMESVRISQTWPSSSSREEHGRHGEVQSKSDSIKLRSLTDWLAALACRSRRPSKTLPTSSGVNQRAVLDTPLLSPRLAPRFTSGLFLRPPMIRPAKGKPARKLTLDSAMMCSQCLLLGKYLVSDCTLYTLVKHIEYTRI